MDVIEDIINDTLGVKCRQGARPNGMPAASYEIVTDLPALEGDGAVEEREQYVVIDYWYKEEVKGNNKKVRDLVQSIEKKLRTRCTIYNAIDSSIKAYRSTVSFSILGGINE